MSSDSLQHTLDRVRRPRVQLTYDVETGGALEKKDIPFVVGVLADLSGQPKDTPRPLKERKFVPIDRDTFNEVLAKAEPRLTMRVPNRLTGEEGQLPVELNFENIDDFEPTRVASQIPALKEILDVRGRLSELLGRMEGNDKLDQLVAEVLSHTDQASGLAEELGISAEGSGETDASPDTPAEEKDE